MNEKENHFKPLVAHVMHRYLNITETFIYEYLINLKRFTPVVLSKETINLDLFPFDHLYAATNSSQHYLKSLKQFLYRKIFNRELYYEYQLSKMRFKVLHAHFGPTGVRALNLKNRFHLPLITTFYGYDISALPRKSKWRHLYNILFKEGDLFLVEGSFMKNSLINLGCPMEKIRVVHIGADMTKIKYNECRFNSTTRNIKVLFCGRFIEKKGLIDALQAIRLLIDKFPTLEFRIIGSGKLQKDIEYFIKNKNMEGYTVLLGNLNYSRYLEEIHNCHVLLQPSVTAQDGDSEGGAPTVLLEAQASGLPVISTFHADIPEVVVDGKSGFLVPERNPEAIVEKLEYLITNPDLAMELGHYGRNHIDNNYNITKEVHKLETIYDHVISQS